MKKNLEQRQKGNPKKRRQKTVDYTSGREVTEKTNPMTPRSRWLPFRAIRN